MTQDDFTFIYEFRRTLQQAILKHIREVFLIEQKYLVIDDGKFRSDYTIKDEAHTPIIRFWRQFCGTRNNVYYYPESFRDLFRFLKNNKELIQIDIQVPFIVMEDSIGEIAGYVHDDATFIFQKLWNETTNGSQTATFEQLFKLYNAWRSHIALTVAAAHYQADRNASFLKQYNEWMKMKNAEFNLMNGTTINYRKSS